MRKPILWVTAGRDPDDAEGCFARAQRIFPFQVCLKTLTTVCNIKTQTSLGAAKLSIHETIRMLRPLKEDILS